MPAAFVNVSHCATCSSSYFTGPAMIFRIQCYFCNVSQLLRRSRQAAGNTTLDLHLYGPPKCEASRIYPISCPTGPCYPLPPLWRWISWHPTECLSNLNNSTHCQNTCKAPSHRHATVPHADSAGASARAGGSFILNYNLCFNFNGHASCTT